MEVSYDHAAEPDHIRDALDKIGLKDVSVQNFGSSRDVIIRLGLPKVAEGSNQNAEVQRQNDAVVKALKDQDKGADVKRVDVVGGVVGKELALLFVCIGIVIYLAFRFEWRFAVATIVANLHDVVIILGFFALFQWEFSLPVLAAVLAVFGYSVNESVVVFDRVRENFKKMRKASVDEVMDASITGTISRTIITHLCTQMMVLSIFFFGGPSLHYFALALTVGILFGIYSSVLVACPLAKYLGASRADFVKPERKAVEPTVP
jgi:preprotein translocase subunit SecF